MKINRKQLILLFLDAIVIAASFYLALLLRFDFVITEPIYTIFRAALLAVILIHLLANYIFGLYSRIWRHASISELIAIVAAVTAGSFLVYAYTFLAQLDFPRSKYLIAWFLNIAFIGGMRFFIRIYPRKSLKAPSQASSRVLIIGAGAAGTMVANEMQHNSNLQKIPVGFADDSSAKQRCATCGIKVLGTTEQIPEIVEKHQIDETIIAIPSAAKQDIKRITRICSTLPVKVNIIPGVYDLINGNVSINKIRPVQIEDLLGREEVKTDLCEIAAYLNHETVLVTGAGGSIGSELCRQIATHNPKELLVLDHTENNVYDIEMELIHTYPQLKIIPLVADVRDKSRIEMIFTTYKPTVIFHAAAHKHVPLMECNREEAIDNNIFGTRNVAAAAHRHNAKSFILISTDKAVNPTSVMGATKRMAEITIQFSAKNSQTRYSAVRFGNVLGSRGSVIPLFKKQIEEGGPITVTHPEMTRYFMTIPEAVQLVIQAGAMGQNGEIFVLDMGEPVKIIDLARDLIRLSGFEPEKDIKIAFSGIRPGEKLFEEMLTAEEGTKATKHQRIFVASATDQNQASFAKELLHLSAILLLDLTHYNGQVETIKHKFKAI